MKLLSRAAFFVTCLFLTSTLAQAQTRVHALSGTVTTIRPKIQMTEIDTDDGTSAHFQWLKKSDGPLSFDKNVSNDAMAAEKFTTNNTHVIVYYFGDGVVRTVIALRDLGTGPLEKSVGTVVKFNRHDHLLTIRNSTGGEVLFHLDPKTVADTPDGVSQGFKFDLTKGETVRIIASQTANGEKTALLISPAIL
jgi:hypothetical protein